MISSLCLAAVNWAAKLQLGRSSLAEAWKALNTTISRKLVYPLQALTLAEKECTSIMAPAIHTSLPKAGISSCISSVVQHAPTHSPRLGSSEPLYCNGHSTYITPSRALLAKNTIRPTSPSRY